MADGVELKFDGLEGIQKNLQSLSKETAGRVGWTATRKGAEVMRDAARSNYRLRRLDDPDTPEKIHENIVARAASKRTLSPGELKYRVGVLGGARATGKAARKTERRRQRLGQRSLEELGEIAGRGKENPGGDTFYWRFLEFGTKHIPAKPFMRPVLANTGQRVISKFAKEYWAGTERAIKRAQKK